MPEPQTVEELLDQARDALRYAGNVTRELVAKRIDKFLNDQNPPDVQG